MTTVELAKQLNLNFLQINLNQFTEEQLIVLQRIGRIARNLNTLNSLVGE